jgi:hypothetical protein
MKSLSLIILFFLPVLSWAQQSYKKPVYKIYQFGASYAEVDSCKKAINEKYGFVIVNGGAKGTRNLYAHNEQVEKFLTARNGEEWRLKYIEEIKNCGTK